MRDASGRRSVSPGLQRRAMTMAQHPRDESTVTLSTGHVLYMPLSVDELAASSSGGSSGSRGGGNGMYNGSRSWISPTQTASGALKPEMINFGGAKQEDLDESQMTVAQVPATWLCDCWSVEEHNQRICCFNCCMVVVHFSLFLASCVSLGSNPGVLVFNTKYDKSQLVFVPREGTELYKEMAALQSNWTTKDAAVFTRHPLVQINSPYTGEKWATWDQVAVSCQNTSSAGPPKLSAGNGSQYGWEIADTSQSKMAQPTTLRFIREMNSTESLWYGELWTYPVDSGRSLDVALFVMGFFLCSWCFQLGTFFFVNYNYLFDAVAYTDDDHQTVLSGNTGTMSLIKPGKPLADVVSKAMMRELRFNWLRFVEYSISGTLVLICMAVLSGVVDIQLIICFGFMSATCMLLGIVAEVCLRVSNVLRYLEDRTSDYQFRDVIEACKWRTFLIGYFMSHLLGWMCILPPIVMISYRYQTIADYGFRAETLFFPIRLLSKGLQDRFAAQEKPATPDFVKVAIIGEIGMYCGFGIVQILQGAATALAWGGGARNTYWKRHWFGNKQVEYYYVALSLIAKGYIGILLFANVLISSG